MLIKTAYLLLFIFRTFRLGSFTRLTKEKGTLLILANGPSLKDQLDYIKSLKSNTTKVMAMNFALFDEVIFNMRPEYYCLADPLFFTDTTRKNEAFKLFEILAKDVNWQLNLLIPSNKLKSFLSFSKIANKNISVIPVNTINYDSYDSFRHLVYKYGLGSPPIGSVANFAIYCGIFMLFNYIKLYGFDHSVFNDLYVGKDNIIYRKYHHFYSDKEKTLPLINHVNNTYYNMPQFTYSIYKIFKSHQLLSQFGEFMGVKIINCTNNSYIDSYEKI